MARPLLAWSPYPHPTPEGAVVFDAVCPTCARRELVFPGQVLALANTAAGPVLTYRCGRGHVCHWAARPAADERAAAA